MTPQKQISPALRTSATKGFRIHLLVFLLAIPAIWLVWYLTDRTYIWPLWQTIGWLLGIIFHYLGVFVWRKSK